MKVLCVYIIAGVQCVWREVIGV